MTIGRGLLMVHMYSIFIPFTSAARTKSLTLISPFSWVIISQEAKHDKEVEPGAAAMVELDAVVGARVAAAVRGVTVCVCEGT